MRFFYTFIFILAAASAGLAQTTGSIRGKVVDPNGAIVPNAAITATNNSNVTRTAAANGQGEFSIANLPAGKYTVSATAATFAPYQNTEVQVQAGQREDLIVTLTIAVEQQTVTVSSNNAGVNTDPENNASATVLKGKDLDSLPDDPDELAAALQALAGPAAGPNGGQFYIDGFTGGNVPPKEAIREIRINLNPFSAEYDRIGFGRVEILTKPGFGKLRGQVFYNFNNQNLNSRNPFAPFRAPTKTNYFGGNLSGPIQKNKSSFFIDADHRQVDLNAVINARTLDASGNVVNFNNALVVPTTRTSFSPRLDFQLNDKNTLTARYSFNRNSLNNQGLNEFTLPTRAFQTRSTDHNLQLTETAVLSATTINESRFQYVHSNNRNQGDNSIPTINVAGAFSGGGTQIGLQQNVQNRWEFQNYTTSALAKHNLKAGIRLRGVKLDNSSQQNFGGTFIFAGVPAVRDPNNPNNTLFPAVSSLEQYRARVLGNTDPRFNPSQFTITAGNPEAHVSQYDVGLFVTDDWRVRQDLTLSFGLRYENQNNISSNYNFAPRFGFAWSPGASGARAPKTVFRGGAGIFYDRFGENNFLQTIRFNGQLQQSYIVTDPALLSQVVFSPNGTVSNVPTIAQIAAAAQTQPNTIFQINPNFQVPRTIQGLVSVERQLPFKITLATTYIFGRTNNVQLTRNINAPLCPPLQAACPRNAPLPLGTRNNVYEYDSIGKTTSNILNFNFRTGFNAKYSFFGNYRIGSFRGNTDGGFPLYSYDLSFDENDRLSIDVRHNLFFGGSFTMPWKVQLRPIIVASSSRPFNITTGFDNNGDTIFNDRPAFATDLSRPSVVQTRFGNFDTQPIAGQTIIPRNYGEGPAFFSVNLGLSKNFGFGKSTRAASQQRASDGQAGPGGSGGIGGLRGIGGGARGGRDGGGGSGGGFNGAANSDKPYNLNVGVNISNLFNRNNQAAPVGSLSSPFFGRSIATNAGFFGFFGGAGGFGGTNAGNRRIELQMRFSF